ncbi:transcriptional regulator [Pseudomonas sp. BIGb0164]|uniref:transcriptional regulator n=1 Tax=Pseudomonas sp. BIGb0164 TaxID=2940605 RepID=UPI002169B8DA|nr:transcriptional regulator [Pseudomonas sp. BIGb0164]MCS4249987.1 transcriptional regulator with XRE-family HTH domain [Pseudomonas sp. BIGb0164]
MTIGARLREKRLRLTLSKRALGEAGDVETNAQRHYEDASRSPKANYLAAIAAVGVDVLTGEHHLPRLSRDNLAQSHHDLLRYQRQLRQLQRRSEGLLQTLHQRNK